MACDADLDHQHLDKSTAF